MKATHLFAALSAVSMSFGTALAGGEGWSHDFEAAKKQAAAEHKDLLIDFTGSDWCIWCKKLNEEVFSHDEFKAGVKDKFVLVELDYPKDKEKAGVTPEIEKQNAELAKTYMIKGYPTIMLCDATGKPFAATGYQKDGPEKYVAHLDKLRTNKATIASSLDKAAKDSGVDKAKDLLAALEAIEMSDELLVGTYGDLPSQIIAADPKDETGFGKKQGIKKKFEGFSAKLQGAQGPDEAMTLVEEELKTPDYSTEQLQQISAIKINIYASQGKFDEAIKAVEDTQKIDPVSDLSKQIEPLKARLTQAKDKKGAGQ